MRMHFDPHRLIGAFDRRKRKSARPCAEDDGRNHYMKPIEAAGLQKAGDCMRAALDQDATHAVRREGCQNIGGRKAAHTHRQRDDFHAGRQGLLLAWPCDHQTPDAILVQHPRAPGKTAIGVDHDARRVGAGHMPHGELRIVDNRRSDADDDGIDQRTEAMQMRKPRRAVDIFRVPALCRDTAIERLADLTDDDKIIDGAVAEGIEQRAPPRMLRCRTPRAKSVDKVGPIVGVLTPLLRAGSQRSA